MLYLEHVELSNSTNMAARRHNPRKRRAYRLKRISRQEIKIAQLNRQIRELESQVTKINDISYQVCDLKTKIIESKLNKELPEDFNQKNEKSLKEIFNNTNFGKVFINSLRLLWLIVEKVASTL